MNSPILLDQINDHSMLLLRPNQNAAELWKGFEKELVVNGTVDVGVDYILRNSSYSLHRRDWAIVSIGLYHYHLSKWFQHFSPSQVKHLYSQGKQNELPLHCPWSAPVQCPWSAWAVRGHFTGTHRGQCWGGSCAITGLQPVSRRRDWREAGPLKYLYHPIQCLSCRSSFSLIFKYIQTSGTLTLLQIDNN